MGNAPDAVKCLVDRFDQDRKVFLFADYKEKQLRAEFLNPRFTALRWDMHNRQGLSEFSVTPADVLGQVYEQLLGKVIRLTAGHQARVEQKEIRDGGAVEKPHSCHPERSEGSSNSRRIILSKILRCAQNDESGLLQQPHGHLLRSDVKARRVSYIVSSYTVVRSPAGQRVAPANDERSTVSVAQSDRGRRGQPTWRVETMLKLQA